MTSTNTTIVTSKIYKVLVVVLTVGSTLDVTCMRTDVGHPCPDCYMFNIIQRESGNVKRSINDRCNYPCQCPVRELNCAPGVSTIKDGCDCCYMCGRQHGDLCNVKDVCDFKQGLYCDMNGIHGPGTGICRAKESKPCNVNGKTYEDGEKFKPECSRLCTCQNGNYGCVDLCPDEYREPSKTHCSRPRLMTVRGQCCKQWTCDMEPKKPEYGSGKSPRHLMGPQHMELRAPRTRHRSHAALHSYQNSQPECTQNASEWSRCSMTCGVGVSRRTYRDSYCREREETKLCYLRPCNTDIGSRKPGKCTPTSRTRQRQRIRYEDCKSVRELNFKFCTNCKKDRCCYPRRTKTRHVEFECGDGRRQKFALMWIKSCRCDRQCYVKDADDKPWLNN